MASTGTVYTNMYIGIVPCTLQLLYVYWRFIIALVQMSKTSNKNCLLYGSKASWHLRDHHEYWWFNTLGNIYLPGSKLPILRMVNPPVIGNPFYWVYKPLLTGWWPSPIIIRRVLTLMRSISTSLNHHFLCCNRNILLIESFRTWTCFLELGWEKSSNGNIQSWLVNASA